MNDENYKNKNLLDFLASPYAYWVGTAVNALAFCKGDKERQLIFNNIKEMENYAFVFKYSSRIYVRFMGILYSLVGMRHTMFLLKIYLRINKKNKLSIINK
jgi:hypothetical protein